MYFVIILVHCSLLRLGLLVLGQRVDHLVVILCYHWLVQDSLILESRRLGSLSLPKNRMSIKGQATHVYSSNTVESKIVIIVIIIIIIIIKCM